MKKLFLYIILFCLSAKAQDNKKSVFTLLPAMGLNFCQIHGDSYSGFDKLGLFFGTSVNARLNKKMSLELGFYFSQKGARHNSNPENGDFSFYRVNLNYIDLPILFKYQINSTYFVTAGPSFAYLFSYNENIDNTDMTGTYYFNKNEFGVNFGLGKIIKEKFYVEIRASNSIIPIRDYGIIANKIIFPNPIATFFNKGLYNNIISLIVSYKLDFNSKNGN